MSICEKYARKKLLLFLLHCESLVDNEVVRAGYIPALVNEVPEPIARRILFQSSGVFHGILC